MGSRPVRPPPPTGPSSHGHPVLTQDDVELSGVVPLPFGEPPDHEHAGQEEFAAGIDPSSAGGDSHAPRGNNPARELLTRLGIDNGYAGIENGALGKHRSR